MRMCRELDFILVIESVGSILAWRQNRGSTLSGGVFQCPTAKPVWI